MIAIEIKLLNSQYGACPWLSAVNEGKTEIVPSPVRIIRAILSGFYQDSYIKHKVFDHLDENQTSVITKLIHSAPSFYIPQYAHAGNIVYYPDYGSSLRNIAIAEKENQSSSRINFDPSISLPEDDSSLYCFFDIVLTSSERDALKSGFEYLNYFGRTEYPASWKLLRSTKISPNCHPSDWGEVVEVINPDFSDIIELLSKSPEQLKLDGYRLPPFIKVGYYRLNAIREVKKSQTKKVGGQVAFLSVDPQLKIPSSQRLVISNILHKYLCLKAPCDQSFGRYSDTKGAVPTSDALFIIPDSNHQNYICGIRIVCMTQIDESIIIALKNCNHLIVQDNNKLAVRLLGISKRVPNSSRNYRSVVPVMPQVEVRNSLKRKAASIIAKSAIVQLADVESNSFEIEYKEDGDAIIAYPSTDTGWVKVLAIESTVDVPMNRGGRASRNSSGYFVSIECENPQDLISVGDHYRFGMGILEPF